MSSASRSVSRPLRLIPVALAVTALAACGGQTAPRADSSTGGPAPSAGAPSEAAPNPTAPNSTAPNSGTPGAAPSGDPAPTSTGSAATAPEGGAPGSGEREVGKLNPRVLISHAGGLTLFDAATGKTLQQTERPGFLRLNNAGDGRHVMVSDTDVFRVYDAGIQAQPHGDHDHNYEFTPGLTDVSYEAPHAGHVVLHHGKTTLFADGTGAISVINSGEIATPGAHVTAYKTTTPHHGVAIRLEDRTLVTTQGNEKDRHTIQRLRGDQALAETTDCPNVHGEAMAEPTEQGEVLAFGCTNGPVVLRDGAFHKVPVNDTYSRSGNLHGHPESPIVLGDYKVDADAELERPTRIALIDTRKDALSLVDLGSAYWFRSLARGPEGEGIVLTYDGKLHIIDVTTGKITRATPVIGAWKEKDDWQEPGPAVKVAGDRAYVTDVARKELVVVSLPEGKVEQRFPLGVEPVEMAVVTGHAEAPADAHEGHDHGDEGDGHEGHDHEGHDHGDEGDAHEGHDHGDEGHDHGTATH